MAALPNPARGEGGTTPARRGLPALIALVAGLLAFALTLGLWTHERRSEQARLREIFEFNLRQAATRIEQRVANYEQMLRGLQGVFLAGAVDGSVFDRYVDSVMAGPDAAGLQSLGYCALVGADALAAHVAARRAEGLPAYAVWPPGERASFAPLAYLAPRRPGNERAFGFDPLTDPTRRVAMMQARDSGNLAITRRLRLAVDADDPQTQASFLMFLPIYRPGPVPGTVDARRAQAAGWVTASFRIGDLMSTLYGEESPGLVLQLHDGADASPATLMYRTGGPAAPAGASRFVAQEYIAFAGHAWTLQLEALPEFERRHGQDAAGVILVAGGTLSLLVALLAFQLLTGRARATAAAQAMTRELRASEERYRRIVETAGEGIWLWDASLRLSFANARIARWLGWPEAEMTGHELAEFMDAAQAEHCRRVLESAAGEHGQVLELRLRRRDGSETWVAASLRPILDDAGRPAGGLGMLTDINERRLAEERRSVLEAQLRDAQKMEAIGTLAGGIAHDFNNILAAILGNVSVARQDAAAGVANDASLAQIERSAVRARALVQQILAFSRMQAQELRTQALQPMIEETLEMLRAAMPAQVELVVTLAAEPVWVRADATQMQQVVMNLCTNAWHALPGGRGRIEVGVDVQRDERGDWAHLRVADDGAGMDDATRARAFEPFFTTKQVGHGTGLGLAVVHGIVSVHGGTIEVVTAPGAGTRFDLRFPLQPAPLAEAPAPVPDAPAPRGQGQRVLCVDDDPAMVLMTETLLQRAGYEVDVFDHPLAALAAASADPARYDVVVSDYNMPEMNGMELAEALARAAPALPVIITSGFVSDELRQQALALGVALLQKEYTLERLGGLVHAVLAGRRQ